MRDAPVVIKPYDPRLAAVFRCGQRHIEFHPQPLALLAFRDALRADDALAANFAALKFRLAAVHRADRDAYTEAKSEFVQRVLAMCA